MDNGQDLSQNRQVQLRTVVTTHVLIAAIFVALRFTARYKAGVYWGLDDYMTVLALFMLSMLMLIALLMINSGLGVHQNALQYSDTTSVLKGLLAFECIYVTVVACIKIALLLMYKRAFDIRSLRIQAYILGGITVSWALAIVLVCIFQCQPISKAWNPVLDGTCINLKGSFIGNAVPNIVTDVLILALPIRYIWKMVPDRTLKWQLTIVFLLGGFVVVTSIWRFVTLFEFVPTDTTWTLASGCMWCVIECSVGVISVCLPTMGPLVQGLGCITKLRSASRAKHHSRSAQLSSGNGRFSEFSQTAYGDVLRNTTPSTGAVDRPNSKAFDDENPYAYEMSPPSSGGRVEILELDDVHRSERDEDTMFVPWKALPKKDYKLMDQQMAGKSSTGRVETPRNEW